MSEKEAVKETGVSQDMIDAAKEDLERQKKKREEEQASEWRTYTGGKRAQAHIYISELYEFPEEFDLDAVGPMSYLAEPDMEEITGSVETQRFRIVEERLKGLVFDEPARALEQGRGLRTIKHLKRNGVLGQIPFEGQINNTAAGDLSDAIGVRKYERKGSIVFYDYDTMAPVYCMARNCFAAAMVPELLERFPQHADVVGSGYCSFEHLAFTEPNRAARRQGTTGMFETSATTTKSRGY